MSNNTELTAKIKIKYKVQILYFMLTVTFKLFPSIKGKRPASSKQSSKQDSQSSSSVSPRLAPHVVNELKSETGNQQPVRHVSHSQQRTSTGVRHVARQGSGDGRHSNTGRSSLEQDDGSRPDIVRHVAIRSPPDEAR